ncbi:MAG: PRC-barrel domain-containing protein [Beijerinckiaceae bacterium]|nr:PRC-barrel domain-containing protein [Beijerinckiaceae bacterium]
MLKQIASAAVFGAALAASPVMAQTSAPATSTAPMAQSAAPAAGNFMTQMAAGQWRGSKLVGVDVYGTDNAKIGDISEIIMDNSGSVKAVVIGVGGFLGIGQKDVAVPFTAVEWTRDDKAMTTSATAPADANRTGGMASTTTNSANNPATTGAARETTSATTRTTTMDYPERAVIRMSKQDLQNAPEFKYASDMDTRAPNAAGTSSAPATNR